jgi:hypothetical protein
MVDKKRTRKQHAYYRVYLLNAADHIFLGEGIELTAMLRRSWLR